MKVFQLIAKNKTQKKTRQGQGRHTKFGHKGGGSNGATSSKHYKKKYRGQGK